MGARAERWSGAQPSSCPAHATPVSSCGGTGRSSRSELRRAGPIPPGYSRAMRARSLKPPLPSRPSWWLEEARAWRDDGRRPGALGRTRGRRRGRRRRLHRALDGPGAPRARSDTARRRARGARARRRAERAQRRLPARLLVVAAGAPRSARRRRGAAGGARVEPDRAGGARVPRRARRGRMAARRRVVEGRRDGSGGRSRPALRAGGPRARRRRGGAAAGPGRGAGAARLAPVPRRRLLPRRRHRAAGAARAGPEAGRAGCGCPALRALAGRRRSARGGRDACGNRSRTGARARAQCLGDGLAPGAAPDDVRQRGRPDRAGAGAARADRLDPAARPSPTAGCSCTTSGPRPTAAS